MYVQVASLWYVNRLKSDFGKVSKQKDSIGRTILFSAKSLDPPQIVALLVLLLTILWGYFVATCICHFWFWP